MNKTNNMKVNNKLKIFFVVGTRPNFVKAAPVFNQFNNSNLFDCQIIHTRSTL